MSTTQDLLSQLNPAQAEAAAHFTGPALVIAGAGSGKTRTLIYRIAHLIDASGVAPDQVLAVTFTNKAAAEMRERASHLVRGADKLWMSTFHSAGVRILRAYGEYIGLKRGFVIYDDDDQLDVLKEIMGNVPGIGPDTNPRVLRGVLDRAKSNLLTPDGLERQPEQYISGLRKDVAAEVYRRYEARKTGQNAIDFGDLITETVRLFREVPGVLDRVQDRAKFIHVDEYQDTNKAQYELTRLLASRDRNLLVVGDPDQCLPPGTLIGTPTGERPIEELAEGDLVCGTGGASALTPGRITAVRHGHSEGPLIRVQAGGQTLSGTTHHIVLARHAPLTSEGQHYVYLMYRQDRGYRVGLTKTLRVNGEGQTDFGYRVRMNQEHADTLWVLRVCASRAEASYWEALYAARYNLPTALFHGVGRNLAMADSQIARLYAELDTASGAARLMRDLHLHPDFPHHRPQNGARRQTVNLLMYGDQRHGPVGYHRVQWSSNRPEIAEKLRASGLDVRDNGRGGSRYEVSRKDYAEALALAQDIAAAGSMDLQRRACIAGQMYAFMPLSHLHPGMHLLRQHDGRLEPALVESVNTEAYQGPVYDLTVSPTHTYVANGLLVHNSIYRFRGADIQNILDFQKDYPDAKVYRLEHNYRSSARVLNLANKLIENNTERLEKVLRPVKEDGTPVRFHRAMDHRGEGDFVAQEITREHASGLNFKDMAVLYRTNAQSRVIEESLRRVSIPAKIVGGVGFYDRREIRDILAYARLAINPADDVALRRIIGRPKRGIGDQALGKLQDWAQAAKVPVLTACANAEHVLDRGANKAIEFAQLLESFADAVEGYGPGGFLRFVIESSGYLTMLRDEGTEGQARLENLEELVNAAEEWGTEHGGATIADFLDDAALLSSVDDGRVRRENDGVPEDAVTLMTLHNAKGLEFPVVFIVGTEEGLLPSKNALTEAGGIEEERRLFYVGITRAMDRLTLTAAANRMTYGKTNSTEDSRFLEELEGGFDSVNPYGEIVPYRQGTWRDYRPTVPRPAPSAVKNTSSLTSELAYRGGEKVRHPKFGEGTVLAVAGVGDKQEVTVNFAGAGLKKLIVKFANLEKI